MSTKLNKREIEKFSRQIILKNIGALGQRKIRDAKVLIIGMGGLGCPAAEFLTRSGIGTLGLADYDKVGLSNIHRQTLYSETDINKSKVKIAKKKLNEINSKTKINIFNCEYDGILGTVAGIVGTIQANEILKKIVNIGENLNGFVLILNLLNLNIRKVKLKKRK